MHVVNWDVLQGAAIALVSLGGGALLGEFLTRRADRRERRIQFAHDTLLNLQAAIGDMAIAAEQIQTDKRNAGTWTGGERGPGWSDLNKYAVQSIRYSVLITDGELQNLIRKLEDTYRRMSSAPSEAEATAERSRDRELLREANIRIGQHVCDL